MHSFNFLFRLSCYFLLMSSAILGCHHDPRPTELGVFAVVDGELQSLDRTEDIKRAGLLGNLIYGFQQSPETLIPDSLVSFFYYQPDSPARINNLKISALQWESWRRIKGLMGPQTVDVQMWVHNMQVPISLIPDAKDDRMFRIVPKSPLQPGNYALHFGTLDEVGSGFSEVETYAFRVPFPPEVVGPTDPGQWQEVTVLGYEIPAEADPAAISIKAASLMEGRRHRLLIEHNPARAGICKVIVDGKLDTEVRERISTIVSGPLVQDMSGRIRSWAVSGGVRWVAFRCSESSPARLEQALPAFDRHLAINSIEGNTTVLALGSDCTEMVIISYLSMDIVREFLGDTLGRIEMREDKVFGSH